MVEKFQLPLFKDPTQLPTGKNHISYSELVQHIECSFRHKLTYIDKLDSFTGNQFTEFGQALHDGQEKFLLNKHSSLYNHSTTIEEAAEDLSLRFDKLGFDDPMESWELGLRRILYETPEWMNETFPGWRLIGSEFKLFEPIDGHELKFFKGFVDTVVKYPKPPRKGSKPKPNAPIEWQYWILDYKGTEWGWSLDKKTDPIKRMQLVLYKHYFCKKFNIDLKQVKCGFVICKRKPGVDKTTKQERSSLELFEISVGPETIKKSLEMIDEMLISVQKKLFKKNKKSCTYCPFKNTKECP